VIGNINGQKLLIAANFEIIDQSVFGEISLTSQHASIIICQAIYNYESALKPHLQAGSNELSHVSKPKSRFGHTSRTLP
jgi:hypothetical protein